MQNLFHFLKLFSRFLFWFLFWFFFRFLFHFFFIAYSFKITSPIHLVTKIRCQRCRKPSVRFC
ncbi:MAG: hypothetical protein EOM28_11135 [Clostridia bacterium]|nr:hypothetical protein [Clostridia bacterium]